MFTAHGGAKHKTVQATFCHLDINKSHQGKGKPQLKTCHHQTGLSKLVGGWHFLPHWFMWEGPVHCGWCHPWTRGPKLYMKAKWANCGECSSLAPASVLLEFLPCLPSVINYGVYHSDRYQTRKETRHVTDLSQDTSILWGIPCMLLTSGLYMCMLDLCTMSTQYLWQTYDHHSLPSRNWTQLKRESSGRTQLTESSHCTIFLRDAIQ